MTNSTPPVTMQQEEITPAIAREWMTHNIVNRRRSDESVNAYARDFKRGRWPQTAQPIKFDIDGNLVDGQHRLAAVVKSGVTITEWVARNLPRDAQKYIDIGRARSASDMLHMAGIPNPVAVAASARLAIHMERAGRYGAHHERVTNAEIEDFLERYPDFVKRVSHMLTYHRLNMTPSVRCYIGWTLFNIDGLAALDFFHGLNSLVGLTEGDPRIALSRKLTEIQQPAKEKDEIIAYTYRAWNSWRKDEPLSFMRLSLDERGRPRMPIPI